jgi:hypothetical protein
LKSCVPSLRQKEEEAEEEEETGENRGPFGVNLAVIGVSGLPSDAVDSSLYIRRR